MYEFYISLINPVLYISTNAPEFRHQSNFVTSKMFDISSDKISPQELICALIRVYRNVSWNVQIH